MPTYNYPYVNPISVPVDLAELSLNEARTLARNAVLSVEPQLTEERMERMNCAWDFELSRDLGWFWSPSGTWLFSWWDENDNLVAQAYVWDESAKVSIVFIRLDCHDDDPDNGLAVYTEF